MGKKFLIFIVLLNLLTSANAQKSKEELLKIFDEGEENRGKAARSLGIYYDRIEDYKNAEFYFDKQIVIGEETNDNQLFFDGLFQKVKMNYFRGKTEATTFYIDKIFEKAEGDSSKYAILGAARAYQYSAKIAQYLESDFEKAHLLFVESDKLVRKIGNANTFLQNKWDRCNIYFLQNDFSALIEAVDNALIEVKSFSGKEPSQSSIDDLLYFKAAVIGRTSKDPIKRMEGLAFMKSKLSNAEKSESTFNVVGTTADILDLYVKEIGRDSAIYYGDKAYRLIKKNPEGGNTSDFLLSYSQVLISLGFYKKALPMLKEARIAFDNQENPFSKMVELLDLEVRAFTKKGDSDAALKSYDQLLLYKDSLQSQEQQNEIEKIELTYSLEKKETENNVLKLENNIVRSRSQLLAIVGGFLFMILGGLVYFYLKIKKNERRLSRINASKNRLFAILAHDLKGPALQFNNLSENLSFLLKKGDKKQLLSVASQFEKSGNQVRYIIDNLLNWAISQKDEFSHNPKRINIKKQLDEVVLELEYALSEKNITIDSKIEEVDNCIFDPNAFKVVIRNLLHNAVKYSEEDSTIFVEKDPQNSNLKIIDSGVGMDAQTINDILNETQVQSQPGTNSEKGNGIGMSTCVKLIRKNGSEISIQSLPKKGTTVILEMN